MGKATKRKQEAELQKEIPYLKTLQSKSPVKKVKDRTENLKRARDWFESFRIAYVQFEINDPSNFNVLSFNEHSLRKSLVRFAYVKYNVPEFLFKFFVDKATRFQNNANYNTALMWFLEITSGMSFYKQNKALFTKKEAHLYLHAPNHLDPFENVIWTRCKTSGLRSDLASIVYKHATIISQFNRKRWKDFIEFLVRNQDRKILDSSLRDVIDYVARQPEAFTFAGRTWTSIVRHSKRWHRDSHWAAYANPYMEWVKQGKDLDFEFEFNYSNWQFVELLNSEQLLEESVKQNHCVVMYKSNCANGQCRIVSMMKDEKKQLTVEINRNSIIQVRGNHNRKPDQDEMAALRKWAHTVDLRVGTKW